MSDDRPKLHKTLLILILVLTPPFWLLFTDEGGRVSDTAMLWLLGEKEIKVNIAELDGGFSQKDIQTVFSDLEWLCDAAASDFGDGICAARVGTYNGFPSSLLTFYFRADRVTAMKLDYRPIYHDQIVGYHIGQLGQPDNVAAAVGAGPDADNVLQWDLGKGLLLIKKSLGDSDAPALLWLAAAPGQNAPPAP